MRQLQLSTRSVRAQQKWQLVLLGGLNAVVYAIVAAISLGFRNEIPPESRPILAVLALFGLACLLYFASLAVVARAARPARDSTTSGSDAYGITFGGVLLFSIFFRVILLTSVPIQEVDFYRYLWDGRVFCQGFNPYRFAPSQVDEATVDAPPDLSGLVRIRDMSCSVKEIFSRVHHRQVPTIYPPAAQVLFAICAAITPAAAPVWLHVSVLKLLLIAVDVAILFAMRGLLRHVGFAEAWCLAYGWCPLAIKEVANSAHIDALAVLFTLAALQMLLKAAPSKTSGSASIARWTLAGGLLGLAILSKTYPILLLPLMTTFAFSHIRGRALLPLVACLAIVATGYLPFLEFQAIPGSTGGSLPHVNPSIERQGPWSGLGTFLTQWQMNDLLFMVVHENLRQPHEETSQWFVITPRDWRREFNRRTESSLARLAHAPGVDPAFVMTQVLMGTVLFGLVLWWAWQVFNRAESLVLLRSVFLVLAWAWFLSSAQNPWYVLWFLPLMPFARCRSWFLVPCLSLVYYLRFWFIYHGVSAATTEYAKFDFGWVWVEHGVGLASLALESWLRPRDDQSGH
ncbi:MAG: hypothetical protein HY288_07070 [Planctomycetia bacterium]|nr:hypothetical protein [Planctomycetia bacterium]